VVTWLLAISDDELTDDKKGLTLNVTMICFVSKRLRFNLQAHYKPYVFD